MRDADFDSLKNELKLTLEKLRVLQKLYHSETGINFMDVSLNRILGDATYDDETATFYYDNRTYGNIDDLVDDIEHDLEAHQYYVVEKHQRQFG